MKNTSYSYPTKIVQNYFSISWGPCYTMDELPPRLMLFFSGGSAFKVSVFLVVVQGLSCFAGMF